MQLSFHLKYNKKIKVDVQIHWFGQTLAKFRGGYRNLACAIPKIIHHTPSNDLWAAPNTSLYVSLCRIYIHIAIINAVMESIIAQLTIM